MHSMSSSFLPQPGIDSILALRRPPLGDRSQEGQLRNTDAEKRPAARVLVVEDDWFAGMDMISALQDAGFAVLELATSAEEAIEAACVNEPDIIIMDVRLVGERDGVDTALEIGRRFGIRCLFVSAFVDKGLRSRAEPVRPFGWLTKPVAGETLVTAVRNALARE